MNRGRVIGFGVLVGLGLAACASAETAFTTKVANMRAGPGPEYPVVMQLGPGAPLEVAGCVDDWSWCDVIAGVNRGWVYAGNLEYPYEGRRVPIIRYGHDIGFPIAVFSVGPYWDTYYRNRPWYSRRHYWASRAPVHRPLVVRPPAGRVLRPGPGPGPRPRVIERSPRVYRPNNQPRHVERPHAPNPRPHTPSTGPRPGRRRPH